MYVTSDLGERLDEARDLTGIFDLVKDLVERELGTSRAGLMLGLARLGLAPGSYLGGYFVLGSNAIVLNRDVLDYVELEHPQYHTAYAFNVLLHEYLHTVGYLDERELRELAHELIEDELGPEHPATRIAAAMNPASGDRRAPAFFRKLTMPQDGWLPADPEDYEIVRGFDPGATPYIY